MKGLPCDPLRPLWFKTLVQRSQHHSLDPILQMKNVEVDEQTHALTTQAKVGEQLGLMNRVNHIYTLHFNDHELLDQQIDPVP